MNLTDVVGLYNYWVVIFLMMTGFYIMLARKNLIKSVIGLNIFQTSVFLLYITMGKVRGGTAPIIPPEVYETLSHGKSHHGDEAHAIDLNAIDLHAGDLHAGDLHAADIDRIASSPAGDLIYSNPLPSVLMLTAIVVGVATMALALSLVVRIREDYGTIDEETILQIDRSEIEVKTNRRSGGMTS